MVSFTRKQAIKLYELAAGRHFLASLDELNRTQWLSREELLALQQNKLYRLLEYAYTFVPYYRRLFDQINFRPDDILTDPASLQKIPPISKTIINENFDELITTDTRRRNKMSKNFTGGSTGQPLTFIQDNNFRNYVMADIHRHIQWTGWQLGQCHAYIWGTDYEVQIQQTLRTRLMDWALNRFLTNAFLLSEASMAAFAQKIREKQPKVLFGYASAITRFAKFVQENQWNDIKSSGIISTAEILYPDQRKIIEDTFDCIVLNRYGTRELGGIACECPQQMGLHISAENVYIEILRDNEPVPKEEEGDIVVTALNNYAMPFIRYHTEDVGQLSETGCRCGRESPMIQVVLGRLTDLFKTKDGNTIHGEFFTHLFYGINEVKQFQIIQESYDHIAVHIVKRTSLPPEKMIYIEQAIKDIMKTDVRVSFRFLDIIPPQSSGKYHFTVSKVDQK